MKKGSIVELVSKLTAEDIKVVNLMRSRTGCTVQLGKKIPYVVKTDPRPQSWSMGGKISVVYAMKLEEFPDAMQFNSDYFAEIQGPDEGFAEEVVADCIPSKVIVSSQNEISHEQRTGREDLQSH